MIAVNRLCIEDARILIEGARQKAAQIGVPMCIAVTAVSYTHLTLPTILLV